MAASGTAVSPSLLNCNRELLVNNNLHVRRGTAVILRELRWFLSEQRIKEPILGHPILEDMGMDCRRTLEAAAERDHEVFDATCIRRPRELGMRVGMITEGVYHLDHGLEVDPPVDEENH